MFMEIAQSIGSDFSIDKIINNKCKGINELIGKNTTRYYYNDIHLGKIKFEVYKDKINVACEHPLFKKRKPEIIITDDFHTFDNEELDDYVIMLKKINTNEDKIINAFLNYTIMMCLN